MATEKFPLPEYGLLPRAWVWVAAADHPQPYRGGLTLVFWDDGRPTLPMFYDEDLAERCLMKAGETHHRLKELSTFAAQADYAQSAKDTMRVTHVSPDYTGPLRPDDAFISNVIYTIDHFVTECRRLHAEGGATDPG
jgi:hypothetical protein